MRKALIKTLAVMVLTTMGTFGLANANATGVKAEAKEFKSIGYFYQENGDVMNVDVTKITHLNYSFGLIYHNEEGNQQNVPRDDSKLNTVYLPEKVKADLKLIPELKKKNPELKVLLSVGGWDCRGFSGAASTKESREAFAKSCLDLVNEYKLDGIDIDWEYPVNGGWGVIDAKPEDKENYTLLLQEVRDKIGKNTLLTIAGGANVNFVANWTEFDKIIPILDYINVMTYDMAYGTCYNNAGLYDSEQFPTKLAGDNYNVNMIINNYLKAGAKSTFLNLGVPFYARIPRIAVEPAKDWDQGGIPVTTPWFDESKLLEVINKAGVVNPSTLNYSDLAQFLINKNGFTRQWDKTAKVPYLTFKDASGVDQYAITYEDEESLGYKTQYIKDMNLGGAMFWEFAGDYKNTLATKLATDLSIGVKPEVKPVVTPVVTPVITPVVKPADKNPATGEKNNTVLPIVLMSSLAVVAVLLVRKKVIN
ncbi:MAG: glycosyl hydrolase family 18 protein [Clostridium sp.]